MQWACALLSSVACPAVQNVSTWSHELYCFYKIYWIRNVCFHFLYSFSEKNLILGRTQWDMIKNYILVSVWRTHFSCQISLKQNFSTDFRKIFKSKISWKSIHWDSSCSMRTDGRTDGRTDMTKLIVAFRNFAISHKNIRIFQSFWRRINSPKILHHCWNCFDNKDCPTSEKDQTVKKTQWNIRYYGHTCW